MSRLSTARRVTVYRDTGKKWRYRVQGGNWREIEAAEQGFARKQTCLDRAQSRWPGVEIVIVELDGSRTTLP